MDPPFIVGRIVRPPFFIDREEEMNRLVHSLGTLSENQLVIGLRRMGKSSLLSNVSTEIQRQYPQTLPVHIDCRRITSLQTFADALVTAVLEAYHARHPVAGWLALKRRLMTDHISQLVPEVSRVGGSVGEAFSAYIEFRERAIDDKRFLRKAFDFLEAFAEEHREGLAIILDEFQELEKLGDPQVFQLFKSYSDRLQKVRFAFSGSSLSVLGKIFLQPDSPLYLMAGKVPLEPLSRDVVVPFVERRLQAADMSIEKEAAGLIQDLTSGIPFYVQKVGLQCWLQCLRDHRGEVTSQDVRQAFEDMLWELSSEFETRFEHKYGTAQKAILMELAREGPLHRTELATRTHRPPGQLSTSLTALEVAMEIRKPERGTYEIADPVFAAWIRSRINR